MELILGTSAEERARLIYKRAAALSADENNRILIIVPEQYTLETQKGIIKQHPRHAILNIDVVSFNRLAYKVLERTGFKSLPVLRETGKNMLVRKVLNRNAQALRFFSGGLKKRGFVSSLKSILSELDQYSCDPAELERISDVLKKEGRKRISDKAADIALLFEAYKNELSERFYTCEDLLAALESRLETDSFLDNSHVFFDGFTGFTVSQYKIIDTIIKKAKSTCFSLCYEGEKLHPEFTEPDSGNLFFMSDKCIKRLTEINAAHGSSAVNITFADESITDADRRTPELEFLRHDFFKDPVRNKQKKRRAFEGTTEAIKIIEADDIKEEISLIIGKIRRLVVEKGYRYRDIAVVMEDLESYGDLTFKLMEQNGFPVFLDRTKSVSVNPFIENIRAFLKLATEGFAYENVFRYIKCGFSPIDSTISDELDNYCLATGIKNEGKWKKEWTRVPGKIKVNEEGGREAYYDLESLNALRKTFYEHIVNYRDRIKKAGSVSEKLSVLTQLLDEEHVSAHTRRLLSSEIGEETRQTVKKTGALFRETQALFGDEKISTEEFAEMLDAAFEEMSAGFIPPSNDCIIIGDTDRTRLTDIRALFIAGVNDGVIPAKNSEYGIFSDADRLRLAGEGLELAPSVREQAFIQRFYLYLLLTKPFDKLFLSYSRKDLQGESLSASYLINDMYEAFKALRVQTPGEEDLALSEMGLVKAPGIWTPGKEDILLGEEAVAALYGTEVSGSISSFESFAGCPFTYFMRKGLGIYPRERYEFNPADFGTIVHDILYRVLKSCTDKNIRVDELSADGRDALVEEQLAIAENEYYILSDNERNKFIRYRIKQITSSTLKAVGYQLAGGAFKPYGFEKRFTGSREIQGGSLTFTGVVDRSDISLSGNEVYFRIVDYKTGHNEFNLTKFYYGRQLQLVAYMNAVYEELSALYPGKNVIPSALLYMLAKDPFAEEKGHRLRDNEIEEQIRSGLSMKGLVTEDDLSMIKNDSDGKGDIIDNLKFKDGVPLPGPRHTRVSREHMKSLRGFALHKTEEIAGDILKGRADISPLTESGTVPRPVCAYCDYYAVCNYTPELAVSKRVMKRCSEEELWEKIEVHHVD